MLKKTKNTWDLKDVSEEQQGDLLFRTNKVLMNNYHLTKKKNTAVDHSGNNTILRRLCKLLNGVIL